MDEQQLLQERYANLLEEERRVLREIHEIAVYLDRNAEITKQTWGILEHLDELFLLVVVGEVKSGKSCFINALVGEFGEAMTRVGRDGQVRIHGEIWEATSSEIIGEGSDVEVVAVRGLKLEVRAKNQEGA